MIKKCILLMSYLHGVSMATSPLKFIPTPDGLKVVVSAEGGYGRVSVWYAINKPLNTYDINGFSAHFFEFQLNGADHWEQLERKLHAHVGDIINYWMWTGPSNGKGGHFSDSLSFTIGPVGGTTTHGFLATTLKRDHTTTLKLEASTIQPPTTQSHPTVVKTTTGFKTSVTLKISTVRPADISNLGTVVGSTVGGLVVIVVFVVVVVIFTSRNKPSKEEVHTDDPYLNPVSDKTFFKFLRNIKHEFQDSKTHTEKENVYDEPTC